MPAHSPDTNAFVEVSRAVEQAAGKPIADQRAEFAGSAITGRGRAYATWFGSEPLDWGSLLERWSPSAPAVGQQSVRRLASGGMMANEITQDARVSIAGPTDSRRYVVQDDGSRLKIRPAKGTSIGRSAGAGRADLRARRASCGGRRGRHADVGARGKPPTEPPLDGPAQGPVTGSVITAGAGAVRVSGVMSQHIEFEVPEGVDNARAEVTAGYPLPADIDLYLQRRAADGSWGEDLASGTSSALDGETMQVGRLTAGTYGSRCTTGPAPPATR